MTSKSSVDAFVAQKTLALAGASRSGKKFGNSVLKELRQKGYTVYPVHPEAETIDGVRCYRSFADLPEEVGGALLVVKPEQTTQLVRDAKEAGIRRVWMQQGSQSEDAVQFCRDHGIDVVQKECILMFTEPVNGVHSFHRWLWKVFGKLPQ
ncbi:MAG: CoA-binding protein [Bacteroidetes bacterium]|nr:CoA-binding protein [Bacteroidota bacterium]